LDHDQFRRKGCLYEKERIPKVNGRSLCPTRKAELQPFDGEMLLSDREMHESDREM